LRSGRSPWVLDHAVVGTITLTSVLIVYDGWSSLQLLDVVVIIVGPVLAMFIAHAFAATVAEHARLGRSLSKHELFGVIGPEWRFLLLAVPPLTLLGILALADVALGDSILVIIWFEAASLGFWAGLAAHRVGRRGWRLALTVNVGLLTGLLVLSLQVILQPGQAVSNGVAARGVSLPA
jgi:hypothetical protein